jgi:hypothetical protein
MGALCKYLRGWASHTNGVYKQQKTTLKSTIDNLGIVAENRDLSEDERSQLDQARSDLIKVLREEELKFYQRAKFTDVLHGDNNTRYFQMFANGKHRKKRIFSLDHEDGKNRRSG